ncbi:MAG TPA: hypothetical protein VFX95_08195, partial [Caulobacteraceae bacterium]|nr:hypothetical protein [Caulobacteraceae bacterium]
GLFVCKLLAAAFVAANAYHTAFMAFDAQHEVRVAISVLIGGLLLLILYRPKWHGFLRFTLTGYVVLSLGLYAYTRTAMWLAPDPGRSPVALTSTRNVYLIGAESLPSAKGYRELYGVESLPHEDYLRANGFRVLDSAYSADDTTLKTYSRMFEFGREITGDDVTRRSVFRTRNATFATFSKAGYRLQFIYKDTYFGLDEALVDHAFPKSAFYACASVPENFFYFLCRAEVVRTINRKVFGSAQELTPQLVAQRIHVAASSGEPWFTFYHHPFPLHSPNNHTYEDSKAVEAFREQVRQAVPRIRKETFETPIAAILKEDPGAVIVAMGDHGAALTRGARLDEPNDTFTKDEIVEDRYGVMVAVYPKDFCANRIFEGSTTLFLIESVARCLNGDDSPTPQQLARSRTFYWKDRMSLDNLRD